MSLLYFFQRVVSLGFHPVSLRQFVWSQSAHILTLLSFISSLSFNLTLSVNTFSSA